MAPQFGRMAEGRITRAGHGTQHAVKQEQLLLLLRLLLLPLMRSRTIDPAAQCLAPVTAEHKMRTACPGHMAAECLHPGRVRVVGDNDPRGCGIGRRMCRVLPLRVAGHDLHQLPGFAPGILRGGAHVKHAVVRPHVHQQRWHHAHCVLKHEVACRHTITTK